MSTREARVATLRAARGKLSKKTISLRKFAMTTATALGMTPEGARGFLSALTLDEKRELNIGTGNQRKQILARQRERKVDRISHAKKKDAGTKKLLTVDRVIHEIVQIVKKGDRLNPCTVRKTDGGLYNAAQREFGSWHNAVRAAGLSYVKYARGQCALPPIRLVSLSHVLCEGGSRFTGSDRPVTLEDRLGEDDPGYGDFEKRQMLEVLRKIDGLDLRLSNLLGLVIAGQDLEDDEYKELADAIRDREDLMAFLEPA